VRQDPAADRLNGQHGPLATLLRATLPTDEKPIEGDWRLLEVNQSREWSPELWLAVWRVEFQHDVAAELAALDADLPSLQDLSLPAAHRVPLRAAESLDRRDCLVVKRRELPRQRLRSI